MCPGVGYYKMLLGCICVNLFLEDENEIILRMKSIIYLCRITCDSYVPRLRTSGSEIDWDMGFELVFSVEMVMGSPVGSPFGYYINMLLGLEIENYF